MKKNSKQQQKKRIGIREIFFCYSDQKLVFQNKSMHSQRMKSLLLAFLETVVMHFYEKIVSVETSAK